MILAKKYINMIITILVVATICLVVFSITYAWFLAGKESSDINNAASGGKLDIIYQNGQDITGTLTPSSNNESALSTTATIKKSSTSVDALATITLNVDTISTNLAVSAFKWEVYQDDNVVPINTGNFAGITSNSKIKLIDKYLVTTTDTTFTIKLWLNGNETTNSIANQSLSAYIDASAINAPAIVS